MRIKRGSLGRDLSASSVYNIGYWIVLDQYYNVAAIPHFISKSVNQLVKTI